MYKDLTNRYEAAKKTQSEMRQEIHNVRKVGVQNGIEYKKGADTEVEVVSCDGVILCITCMFLLVFLSL